MDMKKQTSVEWLFSHLLPFLEFSDPKEREHFRKCLSEAKAMEKEQMKDTWDAGIPLLYGFRFESKYKDFKQYYNETYGDNK
jgi:hypothetical protein